jgi:hypothetical protein
VRKFFLTAQVHSDALLELLVGSLFLAVLTVALLKLTAHYGLLPTDALEYSDILFAP